MDAEPHPIRLLVTDDLRRSRLTVFFRLLLALPHLLWLSAWASVALLIAVIAWIAALVKGRVPDGLHEFFGMLVRYAAHVHAYVFLVANPFPGFTGQRAYPVDVEIAPPVPQRRLSVLLRLFLAVPAMALAGVLATYSSPFATVWIGGGILVTVGFLGWFAALALGRMPRGMRDVGAYAIGYASQASAYFFLLTSRYPNSDPDRLLPAAELPPAAVSLRLTDDLRRSRLLVFFRLPLAFPHIFWVSLWASAVLVLSPVAWLATLLLGRLPRPLHRFNAAFVRYCVHFFSFAHLVGNPFPGFTGKAGSYPVDVDIDDPRGQRRLATLIRFLLALPALLLASGYGGVLFVVALLGWFAALATGRMPAGLGAAGAAATRYTAQTYGYLLFLTDGYPHSAPQVRPTPPPPLEELPSPAAG